MHKQKHTGCTESDRILLVFGLILPTWNNSFPFLLSIFAKSLYYYSYSESYQVHNQSARVLQNSTEYNYLLHSIYLLGMVRFYFNFQSQSLERLILLSQPLQHSQCATKLHVFYRSRPLYTLIYTQLTSTEWFISI